MLKLELTYKCANCGLEIKDIRILEPGLVVKVEDHRCACSAREVGEALLLPMELRSVVVDE